MDRPRHPRKEGEALLRQCEDRGWAVTKGKKYFRAKCPCGAHIKWVHLTPSDANYFTNLAKWFQRCHCWEGDGA